MKLEPPKNPNYAATVVKIRSIISFDNCDNVVGTPLLGYQAIVGKDTRIGDTGVVFTAETQLSEEYARHNNLHRHSNLNRDESRVGYLEDNRRVKALRFRSHRSDALFMPLESLDYAHGFVTEVLKEGDSFDTLRGHEVCNKYVVRTKAQPIQVRVRVEPRVDEKMFPKHFDTENYFRNADEIKSHEFVTITQKLHGTSIRIGHTLVSRKLSWKDRIAKFFGVNIEQFEYDYIFGSRNVTKDPNNPNQSHFYDEDLYTLEGKKLEGLLPKGFVVYGELIGWTPSGSPIQTGYTYQIPQGERELYVYRVCYVNPEGRVIDLSWGQLKEFCDGLNLRYVPELSTSLGWEVETQVNLLLDKRFADYCVSGTRPIPTDGVSPDEGVCVRRDGLTPLILKAKSPNFLEFETKLLDKGVADIEEDQ